MRAFDAGGSGSVRAGLNLAHRSCDVEHYDTHVESDTRNESGVGAGELQCVRACLFGGLLLVGARRGSPRMNACALRVRCLHSFACAKRRVRLHRVAAQELCCGAQL